MLLLKFSNCFFAFTIKLMLNMLKIYRNGEKFFINNQIITFLYNNSITKHFFTFHFYLLIISFLNSKFNLTQTNFFHIFENINAITTNL